jgi:hypothetical protein
MKWYSTSLIKKLQIKPSGRYDGYYQNDKSVSKALEKRESLQTIDGN